MWKYLVVSVVSLIGYLVYIYIKYGEQPSISDTVKLHKFNLTLFIVLILTTGPIMLVANTLLMSLAGAGIWLVAISPVFWEETIKNKPNIEGIIHRIGAFGGITIMLLSFIIEFNAWHIPVIYLLIATLIYTNIIKVKNKIWWLEIIAIGFTWLVLLFKVVL